LAFLMPCSRTTVRGFRNKGMVLVGLALYNILVAN
jgi:hypothetical protein